MELNRPGMGQLDHAQSLNGLGNDYNEKSKTGPIVFAGPAMALDGMLR
jgi:hypothetical protein